MKKNALLRGQKLYHYLFISIVPLAIAVTLILAFFANFPVKYEEWIRKKHLSIKITEATFLGRGGEGNESALYSVKGQYERMNEKMGIIIFIRPCYEDYWSLQTIGWPPEGPRFANILGKGKWQMEPVYIGSRKNMPEQKKFEIYAVIISRDENSQLMNALQKNQGIPFFTKQEDIDKTVSSLIWSKRFVIEIPD
ncbi:MAG: hypothetical protein AB1393_02970 [Candidatus Edwardsbacteria bacterium]